MFTSSFLFVKQDMQLMHQSIIFYFIPAAFKHSRSTLFKRHRTVESTFYLEFPLPVTLYVNG